MTRVLLDQGLSPVAAALLRSFGWDAIHVPKSVWIDRKTLRFWSSPDARTEFV